MAEGRAGPGPMPVHLWGRWEGYFQSEVAPRRRPEEVRLELELRAPSGRRRLAAGFWDGATTWRVRFCPDEEGVWTYTSHCSEDTDSGLHGRTGQFTCTRYEGENPLYVHGPPHVAAGRCHFTQRDGTPFFWLADTAWNGALLSTPEEWEDYLIQRAALGFSAIQVVCTHWSAAYGDARGRAAFRDGDEIRLDDVFFRRLDQRIDAINAHGLVAVLVLLWAAPFQGSPRNPGFFLPEDQAILLARYLVARYGAHHVCWILAGDGDYTGPNAARWRRIGRAVFTDPGHAPVTMHPFGLCWVLDEFADEPWYNFVGYQSGHGDDAPTLRWLTDGPPAASWRAANGRPIINLEPPYENHIAYHSREPLSAATVRRSIYWSLLAAPTAGVSYGGHGVWAWDDGLGPPLNHEGTGTPLPWRQALAMPAARSMRHLRDIFAALPWWELRPAPDLLAEQPGRDDVRRTVAAARTVAGHVAIIYTPCAQRLALRSGAFPDGQATWADPASGARFPAALARGEGQSEAIPPGNGDWVLVLGATSLSPSL